jgi:hypothetical protein
MAMTHSSHMMKAGTESSQDPAVNKLNDQSYQAAQQGQPFSGTSGAMPGGTSSGSMPGNASGGSSSKK